MSNRTELAAIASEVRDRLFRHAEQFDAVVSINTIHVGYLCGYRSILHDSDRYYRSAVVATRQGVSLVTGGSDAAAALEVMTDPGTIYRYGQFFVSTHPGSRGYEAMPPASATFDDALRSALGTLPAGSRIGIDAPDASSRDWLKALVGGDVGDATPALVQARSVKTEGEIGKLRMASRISEAGMQRALASARVGMTELELSAIVSTEIIANGGIPRFIVVTAGQRSALVDAYASHYRLQAGDLLRFDIGCTLDGYWADNARTAVLGPPTPLQSRRYAALLAGEEAQLAAIRPGVTAGQLFRIGVEVTQASGFPDFDRTHCGHGIGVVAHEYPSLNAAHDDVVIEEGMVLCVETPYYEIGWGGMMVEDTVRVTADGYEPLTRADRALLQL